MNDSEVLAIDIGSTRTHVGLVDKAKTTCSFRSDFLSIDLTGHLPIVLDRMLKNPENGLIGPDGTLSLKPCPQAVIAGGRTGLASQAETILVRHGAPDVTNLHWHENLPVRFRYEKPQGLGADRIADALYAATVCQGRNAIVIDAGTAITVDALSGTGEFIGGVIMPGVETQLRSLHSATEVLPSLDIPVDTLPDLPAASTDNGIRAGVLYGIAGGLNHLIGKYRFILSGDCMVLVTGGGWKVIQRLVDFEFIEVTDMTLLGIARYFK